jgi:hypothetical protein
MNGVMLAILLVGALISAVAGDALDDYVFKPDDAYGWVDMVGLKSPILRSALLFCSTV